MNSTNFLIGTKGGVINLFKSTAVFYGYCDKNILKQFFIDVKIVPLNKHLLESNVQMFRLKENTNFCGLRPRYDAIPRSQENRLQIIENALLKLYIHLQ